MATCDRGCGRACAPGNTKNGKPYTTCCWGCATNGRHDRGCDDRQPSSSAGKRKRDRDDSSSGARPEHGGTWEYAYNEMLSKGNSNRRYDMRACEQILAARRGEVQLNPALKPTEPGALECATIIVRTATRMGFKSGKWLLLVKPQDIDAVWQKVKNATEKGELGFASKKKLQPLVRGMVSICVYVRDLTNKSEVRRVLDCLKVLLPKGGPPQYPPVVFAGFKPDVFTALGLYGGNQWKLPVSQPDVWDV